MSIAPTACHPFSNLPTMFLPLGLSPSIPTSLQGPYPQPWRLWATDFPLPAVATATTPASDANPYP